MTVATLDSVETFTQSPNALKFVLKKRTVRHLGPGELSAVVGEAERSPVQHCTSFSCCTSGCDTCAKAGTGGTYCGC